MLFFWDLAFVNVIHVFFQGFIWYVCPLNVDSEFGKTRRYVLLFSCQMLWTLHKVWNFTDWCVRMNRTQGVCGFGQC